MLLIIVFLGRVMTENRVTRHLLFKEVQAFKSFYEHNPNAFYTLDLEGRVLATNKACRKMFGDLGTDRGEWIFFDVVADEERQRVHAHFLEAAQGDPQSFEATVLHQDGRRLQVNITNMPIFADGSVAGVYGIAKDMTEQKAAEQERMLSAQRYQELMESIEAVVWEGDPETFEYTFISPQSERILGYKPEQLIKDHDFWKSRVHPDDYETMITFCQAELQAGRNHMHEYRMLAADGRVVWLKECVTVVQEDGRVTGCRGIMVNITDRKLAEERLQHIAYYDVLTSLPNRTRFEDRLQLEMTRAQSRSQPLAVLLLDLDRFKYINDSLGHCIGDELIRAVAERLKTCVDEKVIVSRIGGDEFTLILPGLHSQDAGQVAEMILQRMAAPFVIEQHELFVTCSIGISFFPEQGSDLTTLIKHAELAMYRAKELGRNNHQFYATSMNEDALQKLSLERFLRKALGLNEFVLFYQPQVNVKSGKIFGFEALLRWKHPILGMVSPATFIPLAEETGLIVPIGEWVLESACRQIKGWHEAGNPHLTVAVNLSARQFQQDNLVEMVERVLAETGVEPQCLELEITESVTMYDVERAIMILHELKNLGIRISLDDFGTGYSSLSYLKHFPIHTLKIDQSFVRDITTDADDAAIATSVIALAHSLNRQVVAEGVETEAHLRYLAAHGCVEMQGYHFSGPLPAQEIEARFLSGKAFKMPALPPLSEN
ncbi:putative bifunctional diguanylate cyclase/phosphodiesterase [Tumebacillus algifaecis]|nr:bifunctional diguanylate cyclase/phosphodiesterase [Tumebacillus algifaecis]